MSYPITNGGHVAFNYTLRHSAAHRWFYYPALRKDELLLFKAGIPPCGNTEIDRENTFVLSTSKRKLPSRTDLTTGGMLSYSQIFLDLV